MRSSASLSPQSTVYALQRSFRVGFAIGAMALVMMSGGKARASSEPPVQQFGDLGNLQLENGQQIHHCKLGYRTLGTLNAKKSNVVLFPTYFSGRSGDLVDQVGPGKEVDGSKFFVVLIDALGDGVSCSPSNSIDQHGTAFPQFSIRDMVTAEHRLVTEILHFEHVHAVMGVSMGGMQTFQWMVSYPGFMDAAIPIVGTPRQSTYDVMLWRTEEAALTADPEWRGGHYSMSPKLPQVALIHDMHLTTPQFRAEQTPLAEANRYFDTTEKKGIGEFDANDWLWQLRAMLMQDVSHGGSLQEAAQKVRAKVFVIASRQDHMVNPLSAIEFGKLMNAQTLVLESDCGHLAPGCEMEKMSPAIDSFLRAH